jgi:hypothetical protein
MRADTDPQKSPCCLAAHTGQDSFLNLSHQSPSNPALSIPPVDLAQVCVWLREAIRIAREAVSTGRACDRLAVVRHLEGVACRVGFQLEESE